MIGMGGIGGAGVGGRGRQLIQSLHNIGTRLDRVLTTDGLDVTLATTFDAQTDTVAADQPPALVDRGIAGLPDIQLIVNQAGKMICLRPQRVAVTELPDLLGFYPLRRQLTHLDEESKIPALRRRLRVRPLENFDNTFDTLVTLQWRQDQQIIGRVSSRLGFRQTRQRRDELRFVPLHDMTEHAHMLQGVF